MEDTSGEYMNYSTRYLFSSYFKEIYKLLKNNKKLRKEHKSDLLLISKENLLQKLGDFFSQFKGQKFHGGNDHPDYADLKLISIMNSFQRSKTFAELKAELPQITPWELSIKQILRNPSNPYKFT